MRKNDLIKLLQAIPGNPEMLLWNGYVCDFMQIGKLVPSELVKYTRDHFLELCRLEQCVSLKDWEYQLSKQETDECIRSYVKNHCWEDNQYVTLEDIKEKRYATKRVVYIEAKQRDKTMFDRIGGISY